jgi:site-specific DNA recombinase
MSKAVRCAIYTRKSSDEGLEQSFNSLDAQREACAAYILSQASEGWSALPTIYDDGGISGGTLERPALQRLLADVSAGKVDIIVVYKVDRLTRSLFDFAKLVELLDKAGTSFVSITQSFNTTTSMGRLTLNMLLSFAQFEREVTAERIRDKLAASKAKGMWMGGVPPLGYKAEGRSLAIVDEHAALVRRIFNRYLALGAVRSLEQELLRQRVSVPCRTTIGGKPTGGGAFMRGQLYQILKNVTYAGQIGHKDKVYPGLHQPIIPSELFERTQALLRANLQGSRTRVRATSPSLLAGKVFDSAGEPLIASHATKGKARYRYYISRGLNEGTSIAGLRVPAREIESLVTEQLAKLFADPLELAATAGLDVPVDQLRELDAQCRIVHADLARRSPAFLPSLVDRVTIGDAGVTITCSSAAIAKAAGASLPADPPAAIY